MLGSREPLRLPTRRVPPVGRSPRAHPPGPVHRRAVDARSTSSASVDRDPRARRPRSGGAARGACTTRDPRSRRRRQRLRDGGIVGHRREPEQHAVLAQLARADVAARGPRRRRRWTRAGADLIPSAERFAQVLTRAAPQCQPAGPADPAPRRARGQDEPVRRRRAVHRRDRGSRWANAPSTAAGSQPENLPTLDEIRDPELWLARVGLGVSRLPDTPSLSLAVRSLLNAVPAARRGEHGHVRRVRADPTRWRCSCSPAAAGCVGHGGARRPRPAPRLGRRGGCRARRPQSGSAPRSVQTGSTVDAGPEPRGAGTRRPPSRCSARTR